ncbi:hypothetical protein LOD99_12983 [Oopsacas minuta]|uniref:Uncharacterized protein n=1 Tax=Oopsacas minuta TaxID=111878 RepID=A0AAV7IXH7_9METZ|nr:hypothetical protein LOD99_12983 [Oopsacas minuta]
MAEVNSVFVNCTKDFPPFLFSIEITEIIARNILCHANGFKDLLNFSQTCLRYDALVQHLWKKLCNYVFSQEKINKFLIEMKPDCYKRAYWELLKRSRMVTGLEMGGAWTNDPRYYQSDGQTEGTLSQEPLFLRTVCHLENGVCFKNVFPGNYEIVWRIKQDKMNSSRPVPNADIFYTIEGEQQIPLGKIYQYQEENSQKWVEVSTGCIKMERYGKIHSRFVSLVQFGQDSLWFDCILLRPLK